MQHNPSFMGEGTHSSDEILIRLAVIAERTFNAFTICRDPGFFRQFEKHLTPTIEQGCKRLKVYSVQDSAKR